MARILILIGGHLCTAPRPQKEADALATAGHEVMVGGIWFEEELVQRDRVLLADKSWTFYPVLDFRPGKPSRFGVRLQAKIARQLYQWGGFKNPALLGYGARRLLHLAHVCQADLTIVHSEAGLWVAQQLLQQGHAVGVDFEDWFSQDLLPSAHHQRPVAWIAELEAFLLLHCRYRLTTSQAMAEAMADHYQVTPPTVVHNVFPGLALTLNPSTATGYGLFRSHLEREPTLDSPLNPPIVGDFESLALPRIDTAGEIFRNEVFRYGPLNPPIQGDFESSCSPKIGGWGAALKGDFFMKLLPIMDFAITSETVRLHWFSQTIGPGRGLELLVAALSHLTVRVEVHLRGTCSPQNQLWLARQIPLGWADHVHIHPTVPNHELPARIAENDIGLALEQASPPSRNLTVTNKLFQYLQAGLAVIATDTAGQREVFRQAPDIGHLVDGGDEIALATAIEDFVCNPAKLRAARVAARQAAETQFCWELESQKLVAAAEKALHEVPVSPCTRQQVASSE